MSGGAARRLPLALLVPWLAASPALRAETAYVIEQVVVNVNSAPDASGERIATVRSGERLEVLERSGDQVHVQLPNGRDGWVRAGYLSAEEPLKVRLAQRDADLARLKDEVGRLQAQLGTVHAGTGAAARAVPPATPPAASPPATSPLAASPLAASPAADATTAAAPAEDSGNAQPAALFNTGADEAPRRVWPWALGVGLAALAVGFALGALTLDRHIRRKYGGLRIY